MFFVFWVEVEPLLSTLNYCRREQEKKSRSFDANNYKLLHNFFLYFYNKPKLSFVLQNICFSLIQLQFLDYLIRIHSIMFLFKIKYVVKVIDSIFFVIALIKLSCFSLHLLRVFNLKRCSI